MTHPERQPGTWAPASPQRAGLEEAVCLGEAIRTLPAEGMTVTGLFPEASSPLLGDCSLVIAKCCAPSLPSPPPVLELPPSAAI